MFIVHGQRGHIQGTSATTNKIPTRLLTGLALGTEAGAVQPPQEEAASRSRDLAKRARGHRPDDREVAEGARSPAALRAGVGALANEPLHGTGGTYSSSQSVPHRLSDRTVPLVLSCVVEVEKPGPHFRAYAISEPRDLSYKPRGSPRAM